MINSLKTSIQLIHFHPILWIFIIISFLTGSFTELAIIFSIVFLHELGHYIAASSFKWRISSIVLWAFGGVMKTDEHGTRPVREEAIVIIAGPFVQILIYGFLYAVSSSGVIPDYYFELILYYNTIILLFNLLPIWPLDGGKLVFLALTTFLTFKKAYYTTIISSLVICAIIILGQLLFFPFTLSSFLIWLFLIQENWKEWKYRFYVFIRFLLKRYEGDNIVRAIKPIYASPQDSFLDVLTRFHREKKHTIYIEYPDRERISVEDNECLDYYFNERPYRQTIGEAFTGY
ncbi:M50 family metallopeptidase [Oceanobacillus sp. FSL W8-0428]|uniref:Stage IV sporulation protein FB n=1 Tax=Oceanobacillus sojae TaxID=582851 RepID=A0A511ZDH8_9BACI|nr:M50 family metallopeptidase [Oceanobacillus sojae]GEN85508.1 stage IV sporulation protein FB [Oceanobacillus sojae]